MIISLLRKLQYLVSIPLFSDGSILVKQFFGTYLFYSPNGTFFVIKSNGSVLSEAFKVKVYFQNKLVYSFNESIEYSAFAKLVKERRPDLTTKSSERRKINVFLKKIIDNTPFVYCHSSSIHYLTRALSFVDYENIVKHEFTRSKAYLKIGLNVFRVSISGFIRHRSHLMDFTYFNFVIFDGKVYTIVDNNKLAESTQYSLGIIDRYSSVIKPFVLKQSDGHLSLLYFDDESVNRIDFDIDDNTLHYKQYYNTNNILFSTYKTDAFNVHKFLDVYSEQAMLNHPNDFCKECFRQAGIEVGDVITPEEFEIYKMIIY